MGGDEIEEYYNGEIEKNRLDLDPFKLEGIRSKEIIGRFLISGTLNIIDIGGGAGFYAFWLKSLGHHVSMIDLSSRNIALAHEYATVHGTNLDFCEIGDATNLAFADNQFDMALLMGPLYHLTDRKKRIQALLEAKRVMKPGGLLFAAIISRYASLVDGLKRDLISDDRFQKILMDDLRTGIHVNNTDNREYFTTAFFHTPDEIRDEVSESGLIMERLLAVESLGWLVDDLTEKWKNQTYRKKIRKLMNALESNSDLIAVSPHILAVARKA